MRDASAPRGRWRRQARRLSANGAIRGELRRAGASSEGLTAPSGDGRPGSSAPSPQYPGPPPWAPRRAPPPSGSRQGGRRNSSVSLRRGSSSEGRAAASASHRRGGGGAERAQPPPPLSSPPPPPPPRGRPQRRLHRPLNRLGHEPSAPPPAPAPGECAAAAATRASSWQEGRPRRRSPPLAAA